MRRDPRPRDAMLARRRRVMEVGLILAAFVVLALTGWLLEP
jgi:hypothetical protein